jgi:hypothetical protein
VTLADIMAGDSADDRPLDAALGLGGGAGADQRIDRERGGEREDAHAVAPETDFEVATPPAERPFRNAAAACREPPSICGGRQIVLDTFPSSRYVRTDSGYGSLTVLNRMRGLGVGL